MVHRLTRVKRRGQLGGTFFFHIYVLFDSKQWVTDSVPFFPQFPCSPLRQQQTVTQSSSGDYVVQSFRCPGGGSLALSDSPLRPIFQLEMVSADRRLTSPQRRNIFFYTPRFLSTGSRCVPNAKHPVIESDFQPTKFFTPVKVSCSVTHIRVTTDMVLGGDQSKQSTVKCNIDFSTAFAILICIIKPPKQHKRRLLIAGSVSGSDLRESTIKGPPNEIEYPPDMKLQLFIYLFFNFS